MSTVETPLGTIEGVERKGSHIFLGVRYAQAPVGELRFKPPVPVTRWPGVYDALHFGASAPQPPPQDGPLAGPPEPTDEDCLYLNVYTPAPDGGKRPVLFWIHGGGYVTGSGRSYNGSVFVREHDVVVVAINYRMGPLGFMHVGHLESGLESSVNNGILDQVCALQWVRDNISAFGGDPGNVTIFGESAGGTSTACLLGAPVASGLFHKAVVHSPHVDMIPVGVGHEDFTNRCIERLGGDPASNGMATLRGASIDELMALNAPDPERPGKPGLGLRRADAVGYSPAIDGALIPRPVAETIAARGATNVPIMGGGCRHEGTMFGSIAGTGECSEAEAIELVEREGFYGQKLMAAYEAFAPGSTPREKLTYALTDTMFRNSMVRILDAAATGGSPCWSWLCTWETDSFPGARATHAVELPFLWAWGDGKGGMSPFAGSNAPADLGRLMRQYWARFARDGAPAAADGPAWPSYTTSDRAVMLLDAECRVENGFDDVVRQYWFG